MNKLTNYHKKILDSKNFTFFKKTYFSNLEAYKMTVDSIIKKHEIVKDSILLGVISNISTPFINGSFSLLDMVALVDVDADDYLYAQSMNNGLIAFYTARWFKLCNAERDTLVLSALYCNLGKFKLPKELLTKDSSKYTEDDVDEIQSHPILSYNLIQNFPIDINIKLAALMHHEKFDGTGYPQQLIGSRINKFAKMLAIIDFYAKQTSVMNNCTLNCPFNTIHSFEESPIGIFDSRLSSVFIEMLAKETAGKEFQLSDGRICSVVMTNRKHLTKPMVICDKQYIDLINENNLCIIDYN